MMWRNIHRSDNSIEILFVVFHMYDTNYRIISMNADFICWNITEFWIIIGWICLLIWGGTTVYSFSHPIQVTKKLERNWNIATWNCTGAIRWNVLGMVDEAISETSSLPARMIGGPSRIMNHENLETIKCLYHRFKKYNSAGAPMNFFFRQLGIPTELGIPADRYFE